MIRTVSLAMIVKDPSLVRLATLIAYVRPLCSEIVLVVDDRTPQQKVDILRTWPDVKVIVRTWNNDYAAARNVGLEACTNDWTLVLDTDELPSYDMMTYIRNFNDAGVITGMLFWTVNIIEGTPVPGIEADWHIRLFRTGRGRFYRALDELVELQPATARKNKWLQEHQTRETQACPKAPQSAFLIHSKGQWDVDQGRLLYAAMTASEEDLNAIFGGPPE